MAVTALSHVYPLGSRLNEAGRLEVGGCDTVELAREFGTPAYVMAEDDLRARARTFREALATHHGDDGEVVFASKALPCAVASNPRVSISTATRSPSASCARGSRPASGTS